MADIFRNIQAGYELLMVDLSDPRTREFPMVKSPLPVLLLVVIYHYFVTDWGPKLMKNRAPMNIYYPMMIYNWVQIAVNGWFLFKCFKHIWLPGEYNLLCMPVDTSDSPTANLTVRYVWVYFILKCVDLLDTVFMVLRKNDRQVTYLHRYHHIIMVCGSWGTNKYFAGGHVILFGTVNSFVHLVMFSYYQLMLIRPRNKKNVWWKKYITQLQLVQFVITTLHCLAALVQPSCPIPKFWLIVAIPQVIFMSVLFIDFYRKTYFSKKEQ
ncbi:elongation of very long chain fatty acids protein 7-like [Macrosteles quadrilineatus]|uniref:elongation of very long chain fatty acids protein 7-like n=1 Tax=Macrosteles quadrilineatus TaxID=74068 RepID=UPI0023E1D1FE|nr:elongation of very long chain fatty acids protein 7-like [Macrosteles quadrilineatus]